MVKMMGSAEGRPPYGRSCSARSTSGGRTQAGHFEAAQRGPPFVPSGQAPGTASRHASHGLRGGKKRLRQGDEPAGVDVGLEDMTQ